VLVTLVYLERGGKSLAFVSGLALGLTVAAKYNGALVILPFCLAVALRHGRRFFVAPDVYLGAVGSVLGFLLACPFFIVEIPRSLDQVADGLWRYGHFGREGAEGVDNWVGHFWYTVHYGAGWLATLAGVGGLALALYRLDGRLAVFLTFPVLYYSYYSSQRILFPGNLIPVYPFLAILAAYAIVEVASAVARMLLSRTRMARPKAAEAFGVGLLFILTMWFPVEMSIRWNRLATLPDTGSLAAQWIEAHYPPGTHFGVERHTPVLDPERYKITMESRVINRAVEHFREEGVEFLIVSEMIYRRYGPEHRQTKNYQKLFKICPLVKEFVPVEGKLEGPVIRILKIP
jgi:4-amino-4-deoxy-L-arabinose transferase-like glycosyltransferase